jgi:Domain of unknown function (DUF6438)
MKKIQHLLIILILLVLGCKSGQQSKSEMYPIITMERTTCLGTCPAYVFKAYPDGSLKYTGKEFVELVGDYSATVSEEELASLKSIFDKANFFNFANVYSANITDRPTTYLYYDNGEQNAKITDYYGAPESLKKLENQIDEFIKSVDWQKN